LLNRIRKLIIETATLSKAEKSNRKNTKYLAKLIIGKNWRVEDGIFKKQELGNIEKVIKCT
jgi:hypothetical protein